MAAAALIVPLALAASGRIDFDTRPLAAQAPAPSSEVDRDAAWFTITEDPELGRALRLGTLSAGPTATVPAPEGEVPAQVTHQVIGVADGMVAYLASDDERSHLSVVDVVTGESRQVIVTDDVFTTGYLTRDGRTTYLVSADRASGRPLSVLEVDTASGNAPEIPQLLGPRGPEPHSYQLFLSPDNEVLAFVGCDDSRCRLRSIRLASGESLLHPLDARYVMAVTDRLAVTLPGRLLDLSTGTAALVLSSDWSEPPLSQTLVLDSNGHTLLVRQVAGSIPWGVLPRPEPDHPVLDVVDLTGDRVLPEVMPDLAALRIPKSIEMWAGVGLPPGWVLVTGIATKDAEEVSWHAVRVSDGQATALPALGSVPRE